MSICASISHSTCEWSQKWVYFPSAYWEDTSVSGRCSSRHEKCHKGFSLKFHVSLLYMFGAWFCVASPQGECDE